MSKRFGRNQRRQMREQIAGLAAYGREAFDKYERVSREARELRDRLERWAHDVVQLMGRDSAFNEQIARRGVEDVYAMGGELRLSPARLLPVTRRPGAMPVAAVETVMRALIWRLNVSRDEFMPKVRIILENRYREPVGYALEPDHRWTDRDVAYLAEQIARDMTALLNQGVDTPRKRA